MLEICGERGMGSDYAGKRRGVSSTAQLPLPLGFRKELEGEKE